MQFEWCSNVLGPQDRLHTMKVVPNYDACVSPGADAHCVVSSCRVDHEPFSNLDIGACYCQIFKLT